MEPFEALDGRLHTLRDWCRYGASAFNRAELVFGHGTDNALDEALALALHAVHLSHDDMGAAWLDARVSAGEAERIYALFKRRVEERIPAAYLTHEAWFAGLPFYVDERVLIPRSPIAELIDAHFEPWLERAPQRVLDLCCGGGCLGIATALAFPEAEVTLADIDAGALEVTTRNLRDFGLEDRVRTVKSDLFTALEGERFDLILANPPYVADHHHGELPAEYHHEPRIGLASGPRGLDHPLAILAAASAHLSPGGVLVLEVGVSQSALQQALPKLEILWAEFERGGEGVGLVTREALETPEALEAVA